MAQTGPALKKYPTIAVCGLDCGLCPRYYTAGPSRCPGCGGPDFLHKHPSCSFLTCCVKKKNLEVCAECPDFACAKFKSAAEYGKLKESSAYPSYKKVLPNLHYIKEHGIEEFLAQQKERIKYLEKMLEHYDDGRSKSFFCRAANMLALTELKKALDQAERQFTENDQKSKAKALKAILKALMEAL